METGKKYYRFYNHAFRKNEYMSMDFYHSKESALEQLVYLYLYYKLKPSDFEYMGEYTA